MEDHVLLTVEAAARACSLSRSKFYQMVAAGTIPTVRLGRSVRIRPVDLDAFVERHLTQLEPTPSDLIRW